MINNPLKDRLHEANRKEVEILTERWGSEDCLEAVMKFMTRPKL